MAKFTIKVWVEAFSSKAGGSAGESDWLGQVLTVSLENGDPAQAESRALLAKFLSPWEWTVGWKNAQSHSIGADPIGATVLSDYLSKSILGLPGDPPAADALRRLRFPAAGTEEDGGTEDKDESEPNWPLLLAQFARFGPHVTHPLKLAHLFGQGEARSLIELESISVSGTVEVLKANATITIGQDEYELLVQSIKSDALPETVGLIHTSERLVRPRQDEATVGWLAELPYRLGQALDPLARIPDLLEIDPEAFPEGVRIQLILPKIFGPPSALSPIFLAVIAVDARPASETERLAMEAFASDWATRFALPGDATSPEPGVKRGELRRLLGYGAEMLPQPSPEELRAAYAGATYAGGDLDADLSLTLDAYVSQALETALPLSRENAALVERATRWLKEPANVSQFIRGLLPEALARRTLYEALIDAVKEDADDWEPMKAAFGAIDKGFAKILADVLSIPPRTITESMVAQEADRVFQTERDGVDRGAETGLPFRVDTIFHQPTEADPAGQLHAMLDGYVVAISPKQTDHWGEWKLVTTGKARLIKGSPPPLSVAPEGVEVTTPLQVSFEAPFAPQKDTDPALEIRNAAASYHGQAMIPWARPPADAANDQGDDAPPVQVEYTPSMDPNAYPSLAYGQDYRIACGYQAPGGVLPMGFASEAAPWKFEADEAFLGDEKRHQTVAFRRTLIPGAPRLLSKDGNAALVVASPGDEKVRPLWKEHVARWPTKFADQRKRVDETPTLFLDPLAHQGANEPAGFDFQVGPPALALGQQNTNATNAAVWRYWTERDRQHDPALAAKPFTRSVELEVDDPAVVGKVNGDQDGAGGVRFLLLRITPNGPEEIKRLDIALKNDEGRIGVKVVAASAGVVPTMVDRGPAVIVTVPTGQRFVVEARTLCDARFFEGGDEGDERFSQSVINKFGPSVDGKVAFGAVSLAIEVLPEEDHLPTSEQLWRWLDLGKALDLTRQPAVRAVLEAGSGGGETPPEDYIDHVRLTHQLYAPDGGPVPALASFGMDWSDATEDAIDTVEGPARSPLYQQFEAAMFLGRGMAGMETVARRVSGGPTELLALDLPRNRGADYLRARLSVTSRYTAIRARTDADGQYLRRVARIGTPGSEWKGRTISLLRSDELPTPRIAAAAPLFASLTFADDARQTGGVVLYLDHEAYNTRTGAGLAEMLEASIVIETLERAGESSEIKTTVALAVGPDPVLHDGTVGPFLGQDGKPVAERASKTAPWQAEETGTWLPPKAPNPPDVLSDPPDNVYEIGEPGPNEALRCVAIMGQTLEPNSAAPRFPCSVAFLEPALESGLALRPNTMARIRVRTVAELSNPETQPSRTETLRSPWSAPIWIHFLPDRESLRPAGGIVTRSPADGRINIKLGPDSADDVDPRQGAGGDPNAPLLRGRIWAALMRSTEDAAGDPIIRVVNIVKPDEVKAGIASFPDEGARATHIRLLEVQVVEGSEQPSDDVTFFGLMSRDSERRIVGVGPLLEIVASASETNAERT